MAKETKGEIEVKKAIKQLEEEKEKIKKVRTPVSTDDNLCVEATAIQEDEKKKGTIKITNSGSAVVVLGTSIPAQNNRGDVERD